MVARFSILIPLLGFALISYSQPALAQGAKVSCSAGCEQRCRARLPVNDGRENRQADEAANEQELMRRIAAAHPFDESVAPC